MSGDNLAYYQQRLAAELAAAESANCPKAASAHRELAEIYRILIVKDGQVEAAGAAAD